MTSPKLEPTTFRFVVYQLNQPRYRVPPHIVKTFQNCTVVPIGKLHKFPVRNLGPKERINKTGLPEEKNNTCAWGLSVIFCDCAAVAIMFSLIMIRICSCYNMRNFSGAGYI
jgi:hypothetical protein